MVLLRALLRSTSLVGLFGLCLFQASLESSIIAFLAFASPDSRIDSLSSWNCPYLRFLLTLAPFLPLLALVAATSFRSDGEAGFEAAFAFEGGGG